MIVHDVSELVFVCLIVALISIAFLEFFSLGVYNSRIENFSFFQE